MENVPFSSDYEDLPLLERMQRVFYAPSTTFNAVRSDPGFHDWFLPTAVMVIVWVGTNWLTLDIITDPNLPAFREQVAELSSEDRQQVIAWMDMTREHGWISLPLVAGFAYLVIISLVLLAISRWVFRSDVTLRDMLVVKAYASLITAAEFCLKALLILLYDKPQVLLSPGAILSDEMQETLIGRILVGANLFDLWQACIMGIGISVMIGMPHRRGMAVIAGLWGMLVVFGGVLAGHPDLAR